MLLFFVLLPVQRTAVGGVSPLETPQTLMMLLLKLLLLLLLVLLLLLLLLLFKLLQLSRS